MREMDPIGEGILNLFIRSASDEAEYGSGSSENTSNSTGHGEHHSGHNTHVNTGTVLFLFASFAVGALVRHLLKRTPIPYTVILICLGLAFGAASNAAALQDQLYDFTFMARIDPHLMLFVFLPTLIFESAFVMDVHTFKKTIGQALILAGPGLIVSTFLTALIAKFLFTYHWSWVAALMFGAILSATDPVAVVAILRDVGASKQLGTIIEGESLLNDGAAIVLFNVLLYELVPGQSQTALEMFTYFVRVAFGGPAFGYIMAKITIFWLARVFNDALVEITITLASTYIAFYIGEGFFGVSGVLAVVTLGIELNSRRTTISPEVEVFLHRFWSMLGYLANTMIFILVGVVIAQQAFSGVTSMDWVYMITLYIGIMVIRFFVIGALTPLLMHIGYSIDWKQVIVVTWGGLRGAVGLSLALVVLQTPGIPLDTIGSKVLFHTAGIVVLTLLINASTVVYLLRALGMSDISNARRVTMATAVRRVNEAKHRAISMLKSDRFLADARWDIVDKKTDIEDPYRFQDDSNELPASSVAAAEVASQCPKCETVVPRVPHPKELAELAEEVRLRMLKSEKTSYWKQYELGMLGRQAVLALINLADVAMDTPDRLITVNDIKPYWKIPFYLTKARSWFYKALHWKSSADPPKPKINCCLPFYTIVTHFVFEWTFFGIIIVNIACIITELVTTDQIALQVLTYLNFIFCFIYLMELLLKIIGLRHFYFRSKWNLFDFVIFIVSVIDIIIELALPAELENVAFSPTIFKVVRVFRILRMGRVLRLIKLVLPLLIRVVDIMINHKLRFGYDIGKGFVVGVEEVLQQFNRLGSMLHKSMAEDLRRRAEESRLDVIRSLGLLRKEHPGVALSVKTHHAIRSVLNHSRDTIRQLLGSGVLDEPDAELLLKEIEAKMKRLERTPASLPLPDPNIILLGISWLSGLDPQAVATVQSCAKLEHFEHKEVIVQCGERPKGLYIVVSGLVKVMTYRSKQEKSSLPYPLENCDDLSLPPVPPSKDVLVSTDYCGAGAVLGEAVVLEHKASNQTVECDTDVQAFYISLEDLEGILSSFPAVEEQLWRINGIHTATELLARLPEYQDWPTSQLLLLCEGAYIATHPAEPAPTFEILEEYKEVVVVSGEVRCLNTREKLVAPVVVPKNIKFLLLNIGQPRLLVIPDIQKETQDNATTQDLVRTYRRKKTLGERLKAGLRILAQWTIRVYGLLVVAVTIVSNICKRKRVGPDASNIDDSAVTPNHSVLELEPVTTTIVHSNPAPTKRTLTPVTRIKDVPTFKDQEDIQEEPTSVATTIVHSSPGPNRRTLTPVTRVKDTSESSVESDQ